MADGPEKDEKTEEATPKRLEEAREKGQVAFSTETMAGATLVGSALALMMAGPALADASCDAMSRRHVLARRARSAARRSPPTPRRTRRRTRRTGGACRCAGSGARSRATWRAYSFVAGFASG